MTTTLQSFRELFEAYHPADGIYDECTDASGTIRPNYAELVTRLNQLGHIEFSRRWKRAKRIVRDNGIAYSGFSGNNSRPRTWKLDAIPLMLSAMEWDGISRAVEQRARLLNLVSRDIFGPQKLVRDGTLPASLIYSDPGFVRSYKGLSLPNDCHLNLYAADIARAHDGSWWVAADRTEAPSGLGYALEHRIVMSQMLPKILRDTNVKRLAPFFVELQKTLHRLSRHNRDNPRVVLLSDGPINPYHLEDAYLARYLGYLLVEDGDLAVRSGKLMLKTLGGLQRVDVVLRHQNSGECDPLVNNNVAGVAGLTQAALGREVAIANSLGCGLLESAAYMAFSQRLCRVVLGEDLLLPNVATWWCGEPDSLDFVLANLDRLGIRPAFRRRGKDTSLRSRLHSMPRDELEATIRANPALFVAQEQIDRSAAPVWGRQLKTQRMAIRCYAIQSDESCVVMDGGLGRMTKSSDPLELTIRKGEKSKDVWIHSDAPVEHVTLLDDHHAKGEIRRSGADLPSRVADNLFWLGRRLVRTEDHARLIQVTTRRLIGEMPLNECVEMPMLLRCMAGEGLIEAGYALDPLLGSLPHISMSLPAFVFDGSQPDSLRSCVAQLVRLGSLVRDRLSPQAWRILREIEDRCQRDPERHIGIADLLESTEKLLTQIAALTGILMEGMTRTQIFQFLDLGRRIERACQILSFTQNGLLGANYASRRHLLATLELADSSMTYRSRYLANLHCAGVMDLVLTDETNPRSLVFQILKAKAHIEQLPQDSNTPGLPAEQLGLMSLLNSIRMLDVETLEPNRLTETVTLSDWSESLSGLSNLITHRYLVHSHSSRQLTDLGDK